MVVGMQKASEARPYAEGIGELDLLAICGFMMTGSPETLLGVPVTGNLSIATVPERRTDLDTYLRAYPQATLTDADGAQTAIPSLATGGVAEGPGRHGEAYSDWKAEGACTVGGQLFPTLFGLTTITGLNLVEHLSPGLLTLVGD